jgi:hypothetical protein
MLPQNHAAIHALIESCGEGGRARSARTDGGKHRRQRTAFPPPQSSRSPAPADRDLRNRDKLSLDFFRLKDADADDADNLPPPDELAAEIVESLEAALERFCGVASRVSLG